MTARIPKRIIQTGPGNDLPLLRRAAVANVKLLNPDFDYHYYDDDAVVKFFHEEFPQYWSIFESFRFRIQRYDFFRYLAVYRYGGFYLDLDVLLAANLSCLVDHACVFPFEDLNTNGYLRRRHGMDWAIGNYAFGSKPEHPFLWAVIQNCIRAQKDSGWVEPVLRDIPRPFRDEYFVLNTTGPLLLSRTLAENRELAEGVDVLFPDDVRNPNGWNKFGSIGVHLMEGSWRARETLVRQYARKVWAYWVFRRCMKESRKLGPTRSLSGSHVEAVNGKKQPELHDVGMISEQGIDKLR